MILERQPDESLQEYAQRLRSHDSTPTFDPDLVPEPGAGGNPEDDEITRVIASESILDAYARWCGKMVPTVGGKRESIMVSCPNPLHPDKNPSAWVNLDKDTGNCPLCGGFDQYDIFAWNVGQYDKGSYRTDGSFPAMRRAMAADLGYVARQTPGGVWYLAEMTPAEAPDGPQEPPTAPQTGEEGPRPVLTLVPTLPEAPGPVAIDWRRILSSSSSFMLDWMEACCQDDLPEEFYFWLGLMAVGCAVGNNVILRDRFPVRPNLLLCLTGSTGMGKSRATSSLTRLIEAAFPYNRSHGAGVKIIPMPGSGEALIDSFSEPLYDQTEPDKIIGYQPVRGIVKIDELASLMGRAARMGNIVKPVLMELYDSPGRIALSSRGHGVVEAVDHFSQVIATTQPRAMRDMLSRADDDSGFLNRWVFATGVGKQPVAIGGSHIDVAPLIEAIRNVRSWGGGRRVLDLSEDAVELWSDFFAETIVPLKLDEEASVFVRVDLLMKKLMLLLAVDKREAVVTVETVQQVLDLWPYLRASYGAASSAVNASLESDIEEAIFEAIRRNVETKRQAPTERELQRLMNKVWRRAGSQAVLKQLQTLVKLGLLTEIPISTSGKGGRPTIRYALPA